MRPYSMDLREKVLAAYDRGDGSQRHLAARFDLALSTVQSWLKRRRETGSVAARKPGAPSPKLDQAGADVLGRIIEADPDGTLAEWAEALCAQTGVRLHPSAVWRRARRLGKTRKKRRLARPSSTATT